MGFTINSDQQRQRISISPEAMTVLEHDVSDFNLDGLGELVNAILIYIEKYNLTQESNLIQYREKTSSYLNKAGIDPLGNDTLEKLCEYRKKEIEDKISAIKTHQRGNIGKNIYIKQQVRRWLESHENTEDNYYGGSLLLYLNCLLEDYVKKDLYTRETIVIDEKISQIKAYIKDEEWVNIYWPDGRSIRVFPIKVMPDKMNTHAYLACFKLSDNGAYSPASYRIASLPTDMQIAHGYNPSVTSSDREMLDKLVTERRIDFLSYEAEDLEIRLTKRGMQRYIRTARLRPDIIKSEPAENESQICTFHCTKQQAEYYFARFGEDVEVISPIDLRNRFEEIYKNALSVYKS